MAIPGIANVWTVGATRRGLDLIQSIALLATADRPSLAISAIHQRIAPAAAPRPASLVPRTAIVVDGVIVTVYLATPESAGASLLILTGSRAHVAQLKRMANDGSRRLSLRGLRNEAGDVTRHDREDAIYGALGLPWITPELREGGDEIELALADDLPQPIVRADIRGDLHMHTEWSDGRDSVEDMVRASSALGYEYIAITDHSQSSAAVRNLMPEDIPRQAAEIERLRELFPATAILHGCEVDILPDGRLDFSDQILESFDIVLASLHDAAGQDEPSLLARYEAAMHHPLVSVITHPANRMVPHRAGYDLDYERLFAAAAETGTILEIDGSPSHLDLNGALARLAVHVGATLAIDSDSHRTDVLSRQMELGLTLARRGWVERKDVINTRPLNEVRAFIGAKRTRG